MKDGVVTVTWDAVDDAATYAVEMQAPSDPDYRPVAEGLTRGTSCLPSAGRGALRHPGDRPRRAGPPQSSHSRGFEQTAPLAAIRPASNPVGAGRHKETTRPLVAAAPKLAFTDSPEKRSPSPRPAKGRVGRANWWWTRHSPPGRTFQLRGTTRDQGTPVTAPASSRGRRWRWTSPPPAAAIILSGSEPVVGEKALLSAGRHAFLLRATGAVRGRPGSHVHPARRGGGAPRVDPDPPPRNGPGSSSSPPTPSGAAVFELEAVTGRATATPSRRTGSWISTSIRPRVAQIRAAPLPGGRCRVEWTAPYGRDGRPDARANTFNLYRAGSEIVDATGLEVYRRLQRVLGYVDTPTADRTYHYAVAAVDEAGNVGPLSGSASAVIDKTAPGVPMDVRATVMSNGVVHLAWTPPPGEKPLFYNVYLEQNPILATAGLSPMNRGVTWTEIYGTPNHDGKYYFAVTAVDAALNESGASENAGIDYKAIPPIARFFLEPDIWLTDGSYPLRLEVTKKLVESPSVEINSESGRRIPLSFSGGDDRWSTTLKIDPSFPEGTYGFIFRGRDEAGTVGDEIARGPLFHVDRTAPLPPSGLVVEPDTRGTPGAVKLSWHTPKREGQTTEVPMRYHVFRSSQPITSTRGLRPVQVVGVKFANLDDYGCLDVPPGNGTFHYAVTSLDLAGNESAPGDSAPVSVQSDAPRGSFSLYRVRGTEIVPASTDAQGVPVIGRGKARVRLATAVPLKAAPAVTWRIKQEGRKALPVVMQGKGSEWWGEFEVAENLESGEEAVFASRPPPRPGRPAATSARAKPSSSTRPVRRGG
ncbi:MAG: fibronectin type III domain-containing protein [Kiritimatiellia bacterium]